MWGMSIWDDSQIWNNTYSPLVLAQNVSVKPAIKKITLACPATRMVMSIYSSRAEVCYKNEFRKQFYPSDDWCLGAFECYLKFCH